MKQFIPLLFLILMGTACAAFSSELTIAKEIQAIQDAPQEERFRLMNALKKEMAEMSFMQRRYTSDLLEEKRNIQQADTSLQTQQMVEARKQELAQEMQAQTASRLSEYQSFVQRVSQELNTRIVDPVVNPPSPFAN